MAAETERFEDVDWDEIDTIGGRRPVLALVKIGTFLVYGVMVLIDLFVNGPGLVTLVEWTTGQPKNHLRRDLVRGHRHVSVAGIEFI